MTQTTSIQRGSENTVEVRNARDQHWTYRPDMDILDSADEFLVVADVPGASRDHINITFEDGILTIQAASQWRYPEKTEFRRQEFGVGNYHRRFKIDETVDAAGISAEYSEGVLTVHLPKAPEARRHRIPVNGD